MRSFVVGSSSTRLVVPWLFVALVVLASILPAKTHASAELVPKAPTELDTLDRALLDLTEAAEHRAWATAGRAARRASSAWARFRDGPAADGLSPVSIWRLDALDGYLRHAIVAKDPRRLAEGAHLGLRLTMMMRQHFRLDRARDLEQLRIELRELRLAASTMAFARAERARKRALFHWEKLRRPAERLSRHRTGRMRHMGSYFDICFDELGNASRERDAYRLRRAARCVLELSDSVARLLEKGR